MCISLIGTWMQNIAQPWLAYQLTDSPFLLSLVSAMQFIPMLLFSLFAGALVDRLPKKPLIFFTQVASLLTTLVLAILTYMGHIQYWHILLMSGILGIINTLDMPVRQAFVVELVGKEYLMNAIALNSSAFNLARIVGPAIAALVMAKFGAATCFLINSISFAAVIVSLPFIKPKHIEVITTAPAKVFASIKDGLRYLVGEREILDTMLLLAVTSMLGMNYGVLLPVFTKAVLGQGEGTYGLLMTIMGIGAFAGAMVIASLSKHGPQKLILNLFPFLIAAAFLLFSFTTTSIMAILILIPAGFLFIAFASTCNTSVQLKTKGEYRGRIMSIYSLVFTGLSPIGNLIGGAVTDRYGVGAGFLISGVLIILPTALLLFVRRATDKKSLQE